MLSESVQLRLQRAGRGALAVGGAGAALCAVGWFVSPQQFFRSYLLAFATWWAMTVGCLVVALLHQLTGGRWGNALRPFYRAGIGTFPLVTVLFLPLALGLRSVYVWAGAPSLDRSPLPPEQQLYFETDFFLGRAAVYFVCWIGTALLIRRMTRRAEPTGPAPPPPDRPVRFSAGAMIVLVLTSSLAAVDWEMSLEPRWFSTMFGLLVAAGGLVGGFGLLLATACWLGDSDQADAEPSPQALNDLGNLLLAFIMVWAYFAFSQLLIIWSGDLLHENFWYLQRSASGWQWLVIVVVLLHFALPFGALLSRDRKRTAARLARVALLLPFAHLLDVFWTLMPEFYGASLFVHWLDLAAVAAVGGIWLFTFARLLQSDLHECPAAGTASIEGATA